MANKNKLVGAALLLCGALALGCGELDVNEAADVETAQSALLGAPGAFYNVPPSWAFCGYSGGNECHGGYSFNSRGAKPSFLKRGVGMYRVTFENQFTNGNVQVSAVRTNAHCNLAAQFSSGTGVGLDVFCRAPSGALADSAFMLSYYRDTNVGGILGGYANVNGVAPLTTGNAWNSTGGPIGLITFGPGSYRVTFVGQAAGGDNAQVTALTSGGAYCTIAGTGWTGGAVDVRCFASNGAPANVPFSVSYGRNVRGEPRNALPTGTQGALVVVGAPGGVDASRSRHSCPAGVNTATLSQPDNVYTEMYHAVTAFQGEVPLMSLVSAMNSNGAYCNLKSFPIQGVRSDSRGQVSCFTPTGVSTTSMHSSQFIIQDRPGC
jgi:hypothetical protein